MCWSLWLRQHDSTERFEVSGQYGDNVTGDGYQDMYLQPRTCISIYLKAAMTDMK
jgi:hypothetical protein